VVYRLEQCERMLSWHNLKSYVDWKGCDRNLSPTIWSKLWIRTDDKGWCYDLIWKDICIEIDDINGVMAKFKMLCGFKRILKEVSRPNLSRMWISSDDMGWCHDLIWDALWIGTDSEVIL
jgi:hypothetical protein